MSKYFDNKNNWDYKFDRSDDTKVVIVVNHGDHEHRLDISTATAGDLLNNSNQVLGDAHCKSDHYKKP